jgi:SAM-dependent methyltransferase
MREYFGIFEKLKNLNLPCTEEMDFYSGYFSGLYESLTSHDHYDLDFYFAQAKKIKVGRILELCCGSGRVGVELAKEGFETVGVDRSSDMIRFYKKKLARESQGVRRNVQVLEGDVLNFSDSTPFDMVILPATSISLFSAQQLQTLFCLAYSALGVSGRFVFDTRVPYPAWVKAGVSDQQVVRHSNSAKGGYVLVQEKLERINKGGLRTILNLYAEEIHGIETRRFFSSTEKVIHSDRVILAAAKKAGFARLPSPRPTPLGREKVKWHVFIKE